MSVTDLENSACDLHVPHKNVIAALTLGTIDEATASKWMEENFLEVERWVRFVRLNDCFTTTTLPHSACCLVYNGPVDSYAISTTVDATATGWTASFVVAHARIWVQNNTGGSGLVELVGAFTIAGSDQDGSQLIRMTLADGEGILLADHCTISSASDIGYHVTNIGATNVDVTVNITVTEVDAAQACCTGGG